MVVDANLDKSEELSDLLDADFQDAETPLIAKHITNLYASYQQHREAAICIRHALGCYLSIVKSRMKHGDWETWVESNMPFSPRTATNYMNFHKSVDGQDLGKVAAASEFYTSTNRKWNTRFRKSKSDEFQTPSYAVAPLLPYLPREWSIWEPSCGKGHLVQALREAGHSVEATDILTGNDFLTCDPPDFDCIVTNPPFSLHTNFIRRCFEYEKPFALLLPAYVLEGAERQEMWRGSDVSVLYPDKRITFEGSAAKQSPAITTCWFCSGLDIRNCDIQIHFVPLQKQAGICSKAG